MDERRFTRMIDELAPNKPIHVPGVNGAENRRDSRLTKFGMIFSTNRMIGCALAHNDAAQQVVQNKHQVALILEDDVFIIGEKEDFKDRIDAVLEAHAHMPWDIITLFCQGVCSNRTRIWNGSTAAYLLSANGAKILSKMRVGYHEDYMRNSLVLDTFVGPNLFSTHDDRTFFAICQSEFGILDEARYNTDRFMGHDSSASICDVGGIISTGTKIQIAQASVTSAYLSGSHCIIHELRNTILPMFQYNARVWYTISSISATDKRVPFFNKRWRGHNIS